MRRRRKTLYNSAAYPPISLFKQTTPVCGRPRAVGREFELYSKLHGASTNEQFQHQRQRNGGRDAHGQYRQRDDAIQHRRQPRIEQPGVVQFFRRQSGRRQNTTGWGNSFFGVNAGVYNTTGGSNAFFGFEAGRNNTTGASNSYFGKDAGRSNIQAVTTHSLAPTPDRPTHQEAATPSSDSGRVRTIQPLQVIPSLALSGSSNTTGGNNSFFGFEAGRLSEEAFNNSFFGYEAGESNVIGLNNSFFGFLAGKLNTGSRNSFFGSGAGEVSTGGFHNSFFGGTAGGANTTGDDNSFFGLESGDTNTTGNSNSLFGAYTDVSANNLTNATAIGAKAYVSASNALVLGQINGINGATANTNVGIGVTAPLDRLHVNGIIRVETLGAAGSVSLCRNTNEQISTCSSSLRYKTDLAPFRED